MSSRKKRKVRPGKGSLLLISTFLVVSAMVRVGTGAGQVWAKTEPLLLDDDNTRGELQSCEPAADMQTILDVLRAREQNLEIRAEQIEARMHALSIVDRQVETKLGDLMHAEEELRATIALADRAAEEDLTRLTAVYQNMKPKDAAALFEEMAPEFAAGFLGRMKPAVAAGVMAGLSPQAAYTISVILAGRNAEVPRE